METNIIKVPLSQLRPNPYQPPNRLIVKEEEARQGGESILRSGLIQIPVARGRDGVYEIGDGWQRKCWFEWLVKNGHKEFDSLPIDLRDLTDEQMADLVEDTDENKKNMNVFDRAWLWKKRLADFPKTTQKQFALRRGISQGELSNTIRLLDLPAKLQDMIISHEITESHGRALLALKEPALITEYADNIKAHGWSVAQVDEAIKIRLDKQKPKLVEPPPPAPPVAEPERKPENQSAAEQPESEAGEEEPEEQVDEKPAEGKKSSAAKAPPKKEPPKPAPPPPAAPIAPKEVKPTWKRKLVLEEIGESVRMSYGKVGGVPAFRTFPGDMEAALTQLDAARREIEAQWENAGANPGVKEGK